MLSSASRSSLIVVSSCRVGTNPLLVCAAFSSWSCSESKLALISEEH